MTKSMFSSRVLLVIGFIAIFSAQALAQTVISTSKGGLWNSPATWVGGTVPVNGQNVIIADSAIVHINSTAAGINNITVGQGNSGILQCGAQLTLTGNLQINPGAKLLGHNSSLLGQTINVGGNFINNGEVNLAFASTVLNFNGSQQTGGSLDQRLEGNGVFLGDGTRGIIRSLRFQTSGTSTIATAQPIVVSELYHTAGNLVTNNNLSIDNTAQVYGQPLNRQIYAITTTNMGVGYTNQPVVFGATVSLWLATGAATLNTRYFFSNNVYLCTVAGTFDAANGPTHTTGISNNGTASLLWIGTLGTIGTPFQASVNNTVGAHYVYGDNLYIALNSTLPSPASPPTCTSGTCTSGAANFLYAGPAAKVALNYDAATQTVRSITLTNPGNGFIVSPTLVINANGGTVTTAATATPTLIQSVPGPTNALFVKSPAATIAGGLNIRSEQTVGNISTTNGGANYAVAPEVGFSLPTSFLNLVTAGGSGYTSAPTVTVSGGVRLTGSANPTFSVVVAQGRVVSVICNGGGTLWQSPPTLTLSGGGGSGATAAFPAGCLPTAVASITNGSVTNFTVSNRGFGYTGAPSVGLVASGGFSAAAAAPTCRLGLYNLTYNTGFPVVSNPAIVPGVEMPPNYRLQALSIGSSGSLPPTNITLADTLELYGSSGAFAFSSSSAGGNVLNLGGHQLLFSHPSYTGASSSATLGTVTNGTIRSVLAGGSSSRSFPFDATLGISTGSGSGATGSSVTSITVSRAGAPSGTVSPSGYMTGTRSYRVQTEAGQVFGTAPTVTLNYNAADSLNSDNAGLLVAQSTGVAGPWTVRSISSGIGPLSATGSRTTATATPGPMALTGDDYIAWASVFVPPPPLSYVVTRTTGNAYQSIAPVVRGGDGTGTLSTAAGDEGRQTINFPAGMTFEYQGLPCTGFVIHANGYIALSNNYYIPTLANSWDNILVPSTLGGTTDPAKRNIIAPFYEDLDKPSPVIYYKFNGKIATIEWFNTTFYNFSGPQLYYQLVLDGNNNSIRFNYGNMQLYNGTRNIRWSYTCGLSGAAVSNPPLPGQVFQQQFENTTAFGHLNATTANLGANGLAIAPEPRSSILFTPGTYQGYTDPIANAPINDEPANAIVRPSLSSFPDNIAWDTASNSSNLFTTRYATASVQPICGGPASPKDVWFKFVANNPQMTVRIYASGGYIPRLQVLDSLLNPLSTPVCVTGATGLIANAQLDSLTFGREYYVRVYHDRVGATATGTVSITNGSVSSIAIVNGGTGYEYVTPPYGYVPTNENARITLSGGGGANAVANGTLDGNGVFTSFTVQNGGSGYTTPPNLLVESPDHGITGEFGIIIYARSANDDCATATALTGLDTLACVIGSNAAVASTVPATASAEASVCGIPDDDVWYKFTADKGKAFITLSGTGNFNAAMQLFNGGTDPGDCVAKTPLLCVDNTGSGGTETAQLNTTVGNTYFIRVYHAGTGSIPGERFSLCVSSYLPPCLVAPVSPSIGDTLCSGGNLLKWNKVATAKGYLVYLDTGTAAPTTLVASNGSNNDTTYNAGSLAAANYTWRVEPTSDAGAATGCPNWNFTRTAVFRDTVNLSGCNAVVYLGTTFTSSITRSDTLRNVEGCDSVIRRLNIVVTLVTPVTQTINLNSCNTPITYLGNVYNTSILLRDTVRSYQGCDSVYNIVNINITNIAPLASPTNLIPIDNRTGLNIPATFSWSPVPNALVYDFYLWRATDAEPTVATLANLTQINFVYQGALLYGTSYKWKVVAKHQNCQTASPEQLFTTRFLPDLIVQNIQPAATGFSGQPFTINWTVRNTGAGSTLNQQWIDRVYLSTDAVLDLGTDISLGTVSNPSELGINQSYQQTATFTLPQGINNNYYVFVVTNAYNQLLESDYTNNRAISNTTSAIQLTPPPDLTVNSIVHPNFAFSGQSITFTWQVTNNGTGPTTVSNWSDNVYLTTNADGNLTGATYLGAYGHNGSLPVGGNYSNTRTVQLPNGIFGRYYLYITTDIYNQVYEQALEGNNVRRSDSIIVTLTPPVDLIVKDIVIPAQASNRQSVTVAWKVENQGGSSTLNVGWVDNIYISKAATYHPDSVIFLGGQQRPAALDAGLEYSSQRTVTIPANMAGPSYIYVRTDANNTIYENIFENNNIARSSTGVNVLSPDLVPAKITAPAMDSSGKTINLQWYVKNSGPGILYNIPITDRIILSPNPVYSTTGNFELLQKNYNTGQLAVGDSVMQQAMVQLPNGIAGPYYIYILTDLTNTVFEHDKENNNISANPALINVVLTPWPDLVGDNVVVLPDTVTAGDLVPLSYTVTNRGIGPTLQSVWTDNLYMSKQPVFDSATAIFLRSFTRNGILKKDSSYQVSTSVQIPGTAASGKYFLYLYNDVTNKVYEYNSETNNVKKGDSFFVKLYPPIDLALIDIVVPDSASSGNPVTISWTVENMAQAVTLRNQWVDALYLSTDTTLDNGDILVKEVAHSGALASGAAYTASSSFVIPNGIAGKYYVLMEADKADVQLDINRRNNYRLTGATGDSAIMIITLTPPPDLSITSFAIPDRGPAGQPIKAKFTIRNNGPGIIKPGSIWTEKIYLSTDLVLSTANDPLIGSLAKIGPLAAGQSYTDSIDVFLPLNAQGNYVIFIKTDANNDVYEHTSEQNNSRYEPITIERQLLSDLIVSEITAPAQGIAGDSVTISWKIKNIGQNPANGVMRNAVYLSTDSTKSVNDALLVSAQTVINIAPQAELTRSFTGLLTGVPLNNYHVLVHTDVLNNIYESSDSNNITASPSRMEVTVRQLPLNVLTARNMTDNKEVYYRIEVPDSLAGETLLVTLKGDSLNANNEMYLRFGQTPTRAIYDFSHSLPSGGNQEILVPALQAGTYYLMVYGNTSVGNVQPIQLLARILNFEIRAVSDSVGGNTGPVTVQIKGSKMGGVTGIRLRSGNQVISASNIIINSPAILYATFNLAAAPLGLYSVVAQNAAGDTAILPNSFRIVPGNNGGLETNVLAPASSRPSNVISMTVEFKNIGNTDLINPVLRMTSLAGAPIAFNPTGLDSNKTLLTLVLQELNGPAGRLRPGAGGSITIYAKTLTALTFMLFKQDE